MYYTYIYLFWANSLLVARDFLFIFCSIFAYVPFAYDPLCTDSSWRNIQIFEKREYDALPHLQLLFSLQVSARLWHVGISAPSMRCAQVGCIFSCATMHSSFLSSVFLQYEKHKRIYNKIQKITYREFFRMRCNLHRKNAKLRS